MSRYEYNKENYRYCQYLEIEFAKNDVGLPRVVKLGDRIVTKGGGRGKVTALHDIKNEDGWIDQSATYRDEDVPDDASSASTIGPDGVWVVMDDRWKWTPIGDIVEVIKE